MIRSRTGVASRTTCPLCQGSVQVPVIEIDGWRVVTCPTCRLGFLDPSPSAEQVSAFYDESFYLENRMVAEPHAVYAAIEKQRPRVRYLQRFHRGGGRL
jgi:hypothetical protein